jgi:hypothetical protein
MLTADGSVDTYSYVGSSEVVTRIANSVGGTVDSIADADGNRLGTDGGSAINWFVPDLHGNVAALLEAADGPVSHAIRLQFQIHGIRVGLSVLASLYPGYGDAYQSVTMVAGYDPIADVTFTSEAQAQLAGLFMSTSGLAVSPAYARSTSNPQPS